MKKLVTVGEIVVEIMADAPGAGFAAPMALTGPFASGAPAIFAAQAAALGQPAAIISCIGDDDFGRLNLARLAGFGVQTTAVAISPDRPTGSAFVRYRPDGSRDFIFNIRHSACHDIALTAAAEEVIAEASHLHVMGSGLAAPPVLAVVRSAARAIKARGGTLSFDPNLRKEMLALPGLQAAMREVLAMTDLYLPSGDELTLLTRATDPEAAIAELLAGGIQALVHKRGAAGARYHDASGRIDQPALPTLEIDPTGAGDGFGGAFVAHWLRGTPPAEALRLAAAAGAHAVAHRGPMEGVAGPAALDALLAAAELRRKTEGAPT